MGEQDRRGEESTEVAKVCKINARKKRNCEK